ncbi:MAG: hypothetical protein PHV06_04070 [bacterium]|nr:hypothetical protein [bacterium]
MGFWSVLGTLVAAVFTLAIFSFLYKDNPFYKAAEHIMIGVSVGYGLAQLYHLGFKPYLWNPVFKEAQYELLIPAAIGMLYFGFLHPKTRWLIRIPIALFMGIGSGFSIAPSMQAAIYTQLQATIIPLWQHGLTFGEALSNILIVVGVFTAIIYFFFSWKHKGVIGGLAKAGIYFLMIGFGASFGLTVMGRISLLIGRVIFLFQDLPKVIIGIF